MAQRIMDMRGLLRKNLEDLASPHNWQHITDQVRGPQGALLLKAWCAPDSRIVHACDSDQCMEMDLAEGHYSRSITKHNDNSAGVLIQLPYSEGTVSLHHSTTTQKSGVC